MHGLTPTVILLFFGATAPVGLMPGIIAVATRRPGKLLILAANLLLWAMLFWGARSFTIAGSMDYRWPTYLALLAWLVLLGWSIRGSTTPSTRRPD